MSIGKHILFSSSSSRLLFHQLLSFSKFRHLISSPRYPLFVLFTITTEKSKAEVKLDVSRQTTKVHWRLLIRVTRPNLIEISKAQLSCASQGNFWEQDPQSKRNRSKSVTYFIWRNLVSVC